MRLPNSKGSHDESAKLTLNLSTRLLTRQTRARVQTLGGADARCKTRAPLSGRRKQINFAQGQNWTRKEYERARKEKERDYEGR